MTISQQNAPATLYVAGDTTILQTGGRVAIVGSRAASQEGLARAAKLAKILTQRGDVVVSGLAAGIDTAAHKAAITSGGRTIAVLGTPLDRTYPRENAALQEEIMTRHLALSQFAPGERTHRSSFPERNRTMALLSDVTVIVEAGEKSGTIHQGWEAIRLGRGLFITKSTAENPALTWPKKFLDYGARVLADDSLELLFEYLPPRFTTEEHAELPY